MKICVYAICKNESKFAKRWINSMSEADEITVLDTGSEDGSAQILSDLGAHVETEIISPWRFDTARNRSLELVPKDTGICVCTDLDEVFRPGWRKALENAWQPNTHQASYRYTWNFNPDGSEGCVFWAEKIHTRYGFKWKHPVHEILTWTENTPLNKIYIDGIQLDHHADNSKSRKQYLPLLELSVKEDPLNDRNMHYLGREYMFYGKWDLCIQTLERHLSLKTAVWADERAASMRYISKAYIGKNDFKSAEIWLYKAIAEAPYLREPYMDMANLCCGLQDWEGVVFFTQKALQITQRPKTYISESSSWGSSPYDLMSLGLYYSGRKKQALKAANTALSISPEDKRLQNNVKLIESAILN